MEHMLFTAKNVLEHGFIGDYKPPTLQTDGSYGQTDDIIAIPRFA